MSGPAASVRAPSGARAALRRAEEGEGENVGR